MQWSLLPGQMSVPFAHAHPLALNDLGNLLCHSALCRVGLDQCKASRLLGLPGQIGLRTRVKNAVSWASNRSGWRAALKRAAATSGGRSNRKVKPAGAALLYPVLQGLKYLFVKAAAAALIGKGGVGETDRT